jgi:hypothetical protein
MCFHKLGEGSGVVWLREASSGGFYSPGRAYGGHRPPRRIHGPGVRHWPVLQRGSFSSAGWDFRDGFTRGNERDKGGVEGQRGVRLGASVTA